MSVGYKFNRRYFGDRLLDRLLLAGVTVKNEFRLEYDNQKKQR